MTTRRTFLAGSGALLAAVGLGGLSRLARADAAPGDLKFLFVFNSGGWDPTRVLATEFGNRNVDMEPDAELATAGGLTYVDHGSRPSVRAYLEAHHARTLVLNGVLVRSIAHEICTMIALTGTSAGNQPDWPARLGAADAARYTLPHLVLSGPSFPGDLGGVVARTGTQGQLEALLSGQALERTDRPVPGVSRPSEHVIDRYLARRAPAWAAGATSAVRRDLGEAYAASLQRAVALKDLQYVMDFDASGSLADQARVAVEALSLGLSRCVTLGFPVNTPFGWDTHAENDATQAVLWEQLFQGLLQLQGMLEATPGEVSDTLAEETVVVVLSEMGRTPKLNGLNGKDHWPYTSVMITGPGITGDRVVGGFDAGYYGFPLDPRSGEIDEDGQVLSSEALGATLLALADVDLEGADGVEPITGVLS